MVHGGGDRGLEGRAARHAGRPAALLRAGHRHGPGAPHRGIDRVEVSTPQDRLGIVTAGKSYADLRQALWDLGLDDAAPLEPDLLARDIRGFFRALR